MYTCRSERGKDSLAIAAFEGSVPTQQVQKVPVIAAADTSHCGWEVCTVDRRTALPRYRATHLGNLCLGLVALLLVVGVRKEPIFEVLLDVVKLKDVLSPRRDFLGVELVSKFGYARDLPNCGHVIYAVEPNTSRGQVVFTHSC
jgi:hypothetical protein